MAKKKKKVKSVQEETNLAGKEEAKPAAAKPQLKPPAPKPRPKTAEDRRRAYMDGIKKTIYPSVLGVIAGFACFYALSTWPPWVQWHSVMIIVIALTYFVQKITYPFLGVNAAEFGLKDWIYVEFMVIALWLVTWTLLLN